jgi:hypothetical protein
MTQFWLATMLFVLLGLTPLVLATVLNRRTPLPPRRQPPSPVEQEERVR